MEVSTSGIQRHFAIKWSVIWLTMGWDGQKWRDWNPNPWGWFFHPALLWQVWGNLRVFMIACRSITHHLPIRWVKGTNFLWILLPRIRTRPWAVWALQLEQLPVEALGRRAAWRRITARRFWQKFSFEMRLSFPPCAVDSALEATNYQLLRRLMLALAGFYCIFKSTQPPHTRPDVIKTSRTSFDGRTGNSSVLPRASCSFAIFVPRFCVLSPDPLDQRRPHGHAVSFLAVSYVEPVAPRGHPAAAVCRCGPIIFISRVCARSGDIRFLARAPGLVYGQSQQEPVVRGPSRYSGPCIDMERNLQN